MAPSQEEQMIKDVKQVAKKLIDSSEKADLGSVLSCYEDSLLFLAVAADGKKRNFTDFINICSEYYGQLKNQRVHTQKEETHIIGPGLVRVCWTGDITAHFINGDTMKMTQYSITELFRKTNGQWKIIHSHESALPPEILHSTR
jgi:ketosteroid isomerase-like protein